MTENESIKKHIEECEHRIEKILGFMESNEDANVDGCEENIEVLKSVVIALEEIQQYRAIGTIEEFKDLKEKNTPKKPIYSDFDENEAGDIIPYKATCPICGHEFDFGTWNDEENHHCVCDQKMDWEGGE